MPLIGSLLLSIGAMKAGTSWLYSMLRDHSEIDTVPLKEIHYFAQFHTPYRLLNFPDRLDRLREFVARLKPDQPNEARCMMEWYRAYLADPVDDSWLANLYQSPLGSAWCAEFSNLNALLSREGWQHVRRTAQRVRILYTMRDPLSRLWSHTRYHLAFTGGLSGIDGWTAANYRDFLARPEIGDHGSYSRVLTSLEQNFTSEEYHLLFYEDIVLQPRVLLAGVTKFLQISPGIYHDADLATLHNHGPHYVMPEAFVIAARPRVEIELRSLEAISFSIPQAWRKTVE